MRDVGGALFEIGGRRGFAPAVFGKRGDAPLLGVVTLDKSLYRKMGELGPRGRVPHR